MILRSTPIVFCLALTAADCAWDAPRHSDFITFGAGESVARGRVLQPREIWPKDSLDNDIEFDAQRLLEPPPSQAAPPPMSDTTTLGSGLSGGGSQ